MVTPEAASACLGITGSFEGGGGGPRWDLVTGDFDGMGVSVGALQWNFGTGSIWPILQAVQEANPDEQAFADIYSLIGMDRPSALNFIRANWVDPSSKSHNLHPQFVQLWQSFLQTEASQATQMSLAEHKLGEAEAEAGRFMPMLGGNIDLRTLAFFFDLRTQQGGMTKKLSNGQRVSPDVIQDASQASSVPAAVQAALTAGHSKTAQDWQDISGSDPLAAVLLHYAYERAQYSQAIYQWDTLSRRGTIACRKGYVHGKAYDFSTILP